MISRVDALRALFTAKVSRRVVQLFVVSALVPVAVMGVISFRAVNDQLENHALERLEQLARNAGQSILQQTLIADNALRAVRTAAVLDGVDSMSMPGSVHALWTRSGGGDEVRALFGEPESSVRLSAADLDHLSRDGVVLMPTRRDPRAFLAALPLVEGDALQGTLWARLHGDSLWSAAETFVALPTVADFCVLGGPDRVLHCTSGRDLLPAAFRIAEPDAVAGAFEARLGDTHHLIGHWSFYPEQRFDQPPWSVLVAETVDTVYAPLAGFSATFVLSLVLALLLVVFLSSVQVRKTLEPLDALTAGAGRVADGHLDASVQIESADEFGELADAFNLMTGRLSDQFTQLEAIQAVGQAALGATERDEVLRTALRRIPLIADCRGAAILVADDGTQSQAELRWLLDRDVLGGTTLSLTTTEWDAWARGDEIVAFTLDSAVGQVVQKALGPGPVTLFPHRVKGIVRGATLVGWSLDDGAESASGPAVGRVRQLADQTAVALDDVRLVNDLEDLSWGALLALARAIDAKSRWTAGHSERVTEMAMGLGRTLGLDATELDLLHRGGLLHDVGKIGVPNAVLDKADILTTEERDIVRQHPRIGARILAPVKAFRNVLPLVEHHHEAWDGSGYPDGLAGEEIPFLVRILTVADAFDAMASERPYRPGRPRELVVELILADSGTQFDPDVVDALVEYVSGPRDPVGAVGGAA